MDGSPIVGKGEVVNKSSHTVQCWVQDTAGPTLFLLGPHMRSPPERDVDCFRGYCKQQPKLGVSSREVTIRGSDNWFKLKNGTTAFVEDDGPSTNLDFSLLVRGSASLARGALTVAGSLLGPFGALAAAGFATYKLTDNYQMTDDQADKAGGIGSDQPRVYSQDLRWGLPTG